MARPRDDRGGGRLRRELRRRFGGRGGRFYLWTPPEIEAVLGAEADVFAETYDITAKGNFEGRSIPNRLARGFTSAAEEERFAPMRAALYEARAARPWPGRDDKMLADWNGLTILGLSEAGRILERRIISPWARAPSTGSCDCSATGIVLAHAARAGRRTFPGLHGLWRDDPGRPLPPCCDGRGEPSRGPERWAAVLDAHHRLPSGAYALVATTPRPFSSAARGDRRGDAERQRARRRRPRRLWLATGKDDYRAKADALVDHFAGEIRANVFGHAGLLNALDTRSRPSRWSSSPAAMRTAPGVSRRGSSARRVSAGPSPSCARVCRRDTRPRQDGDRGRARLYLSQWRVFPADHGAGRTRRGASRVRFGTRRTETRRTAFPRHRGAP